MKYRNHIVRGKVDHGGKHFSLFALFVDDRKYQVCYQSYPDLGLYPFRAVREKISQFKILLDPLENGFDVPPVLVQLYDGGVHITEHIGDELQHRSEEHTSELQ